MTLLTKGMGIILKGRGGSKAMKEASETLKKYLDKKKGKKLDFDDVKKSYKIFNSYSS